jgi:CRISPR-associated protein Csd1
MILQSLVSLYDRLAADPATSADLPQRGTSAQNIAFSIVIDLAGNRVAVRDEREQSGKKRIARSVLVPGGGKPSGSGLNPNYLWDQPTYLLGFCPDAANAKKRERAPKEFAAFKELHLAAEAGVACPEFSAICRFLEKHDVASVETDPALQFLRTEKVTGFGAFRITGRTEWLHDTPAIRSWWDRHLGNSADADTPKGDCLISAASDVALARLHEPKIKGVAGAQSAGAAIVSFNCDSFTSYGKDQSFNAPVSELAAFKYATALNWLLDGPKPQRLRIGDTTVVFWTEKSTHTESLLGLLLGGVPAGDASAQDAALGDRLKTFLDSLRQGGGRRISLGDDETTPFYILGLAPNAARISIRFWQSGTLGELHRQLKRHHDDLEIQKEFPERDPAFPPVWKLLEETARTRDEIAPLLGGALTRAILTGGPYPQAFAAAVLRRIRIDASDGERRTHVTYLRAALLKAFLNRNCQHSIPMSLDPENPDIPYRLGRLFAALEKTQRDALGDTNTSVRERFYASASATPGPVFPRILRTYTHHLSKIEGGLKISRERLVQEILDPVSGRFPSALTIEEQGRFAIGYYHQMRAFFAKREASETTSASAA